MQTFVSLESGGSVQITYSIAKVDDNCTYIIFNGRSIKRAAIKLHFKPGSTPSPLAVSAKEVDLANLIRCIIKSRSALTALANPAPNAILSYDLATCCTGNVVECTVFYFQQ